MNALHHLFSSEAPGDAETEAPGDGYVRQIRWLAKRLVTATGVAARLDRRRRLLVEKAFQGQDDLAAACRGGRALFDQLGIRAGRWLIDLHEEELPAVAAIPDTGYAFVYARGVDGQWLIETPTGRARMADFPMQTHFLRVKGPGQGTAARPTARAMFAEIFGADRKWLTLAAVASTLASVLVLATSLYSMQVYDRVIGQGGVSTLIVLTAGVILATLIELALKIARSNIVDRAIERIDVQAAISVFQRVLGVRLDQFPSSLGTLAAQVRGFETVRGFVVARAIYLTTDAPFALFFLFVIWLIGGSAVALVPAISAVIATAGGLAFRAAIQRHSTQETFVSNLRQGLLVETIQTTEMIKAAGAGWVMQAKWNDLSRQSAVESHKLKHLNDLAGYFAGLVQQVSYVGLVATGAYLAVVDHALTTGSIIACSIVSGRVLSPVAAIPGLLVQWAHAKVALDNLEKFFALESDNHGQEAPLVPSALHGDYELRNVEFSWPGQPLPVSVKALDIRQGERIGVIGAVGAGKSTLLKLLAGVIKPERGYVLVDGLDLQQIAADRRAETIGYLPQVTRMLGGTLRDNLLLGLPHVDEAEILAALQATGLGSHLAGRPQGLDLRIAEGGEGLSRGQKQLVGLTRLLLARPEVWLLDEPTASMDDGTEERCLAALRQHVGSNQTLVVVTHKPRLLELVDRLIVLTPQGIAVDGPKAAVLAHLQQQAQAHAQAVARTQPTAPGGQTISEPTITSVQREQVAAANQGDNS